MSDARKLKAKKAVDGWNVVTADEAESVVEGGFVTRKEANNFIKGYDEKEGLTPDPDTEDDDEDEDEAAGPEGTDYVSDPKRQTPDNQVVEPELNQVPQDGKPAGAGEEEKTEHNPFGLDIHQRFHQLLQTLSRHGIKHAENAHPNQNPQTTADKFARKATDGQNSLTAEERTSSTAITGK